VEVEVDHFPTSRLEIKRGLKAPVRKLPWDKRVLGVKSGNNTLSTFLGLFGIEHIIGPILAVCKGYRY
jgi:hypothetical protein